jgi:sugar/nucleoside kinase (ribokinase family)
MRLYYPTTNVDERVLSVTHTAGSFTPEQIANLQSKAFLINSSTRGEVDLDVIQELRKKDTIVAADSQGFVRIISEDGTLKYDQWDEKTKILPLIDFLKTDAVEAEIMTNESDIKKAARILSDYGPKEIVLTHKNGLLVFANGQYYETQFHPRKLIGRSGRGDTCIASYTARRLSEGPEKSTIWAAAVTSLKMEAEGPIRRNLEDVEILIQNKYQK